jgi:hypothetical protein
MVKVGVKEHKTKRLRVRVRVRVKGHKTKRHIINNTSLRVFPD